MQEDQSFDNLSDNTPTLKKKLEPWNKVDIDIEYVNQLLGKY